LRRVADFFAAAARATAFVAFLRATTFLVAAFLTAVFLTAAFFAAFLAVVFDLAFGADALSVLCGCPPDAFAAARFFPAVGASPSSTCTLPLKRSIAVFATCPVS